MGCDEKETREPSETPRSRREAEVELGKLPRFLRGAASDCVAAGGEGRSTLLECGSLLLGFLFFGAFIWSGGILNTACCTQGSGVARRFQEPRAVREDNVNSVMR